MCFLSFLEIYNWSFKRPFTQQFSPSRPEGDTWNFIKIRVRTMHRFHQIKYPKTLPYYDRCWMSLYSNELNELKSSRSWNISVSQLYWWLLAAQAHRTPRVSLPKDCAASQLPHKKRRKHKREKTRAKEETQQLVITWLKTRWTHARWFRECLKREDRKWSVCCYLLCLHWKYKDLHILKWKRRKVRPFPDIPLSMKTGKPILAERK